MAKSRRTASWFRRSTREQKKRAIQEHSKLIRFTPFTEIARRTGLLYETIAVLHHAAPRGGRLLNEKIDFVLEVLKDPARAYLADHPSVWWISRVIQLAPDHAAIDIQKEILSERRRNRIYANGYIPSEKAIYRIINRLNLRPRDFRARLIERRGKTRPDNNLSQPLRDQMVANALEYVRKKCSNMLDKTPDLDDYFVDRLTREARRFRTPASYTEKEVMAKWVSFVGKIVRPLLKDGLRAKGPYTRGGRRRTPRLSASLDFVPVSASLPKLDIKQVIANARPSLKKSEKAFLRHLSNGLSTVEIARAMRVSIWRVNQIKAGLRAKLRF